MGKSSMGTRVEYCAEAPAIDLPRTHHWDLPADHAVKNEIIEAIIEQLGGRERMNPSLHFRYRLVLDEALTNAITHGSAGSGRPPAAVECFCDDGTCVVQVTDHGPGFELAALPDPNAPGNEFREHGRGILIMERYTQRLVYSNGGRTVTLWLRIES